MWYVIKTDFGKELNAKEELSKVPQISARLPLRRVTTSNKGNKQSVRFKPLIDGILFINVRKKDISADICPLFNAVKKAEQKIANPVKRYAKDEILNACTASSTNSLSSCKNKNENG